MSCFAIPPDEVPLLDALVVPRCEAVAEEALAISLEPGTDFALRPESFETAAVDCNDGPPMLQRVGSDDAAAEGVKAPRPTLPNEVALDQEPGFIAEKARADKRGVKLEC